MAPRKKKVTNENKIKEIYEENAEKYRSLKEEVIFILENEANKTRIKMHHIVGRVKTLESCLAKIERKGSAYSFNDITDLAGIRAVCLFMSDIERLSQIIRSSFIVHSEDNKIDNHEVSSFGYMSFHFICSIRDEYHGPRYDFIKDNVFEIQVRTIAMDAWATISHYLDYKSDSDVPSELRRDFYALSGLFYVADSHFEMFYNQSQSGKKKIRKIFESKKLPYDQEINLDTVSEYLIKKYPDREHEGSSVDRRRSVSDFVSELTSSGYKTIGELDENVNAAKKAFEAYERDQPPGGETGGKFVDLGVARISLDIIDPEFARMRKSEFGYDEYRKLLKH